MVNFLNFWIALATTVINFAITWSYFLPWNPTSRSNDPNSLYYNFTHVISNSIGTLLIAAGIGMGWKMKNLWYIYDPTGALKDEEFDYFKWTDMEGDDSTHII